MRFFDQPMSPDERLHAVASILAVGILRLHARAALPTDLAQKNLPESGQTHLEVRASDALNEMWSLNRLPSYDPEDPANEGSVVVLRGIQDVDQARELLVTYLNQTRIDGDSDEITPFHENILPLLIEKSAGRPGIFLQDAYRLWDRAAAQGLPAIDRKAAESIRGLNKAGVGRRAAVAVPDPDDAAISTTY